MDGVFGITLIFLDLISGIFEKNDTFEKVLLKSDVTGFGKSELFLDEKVEVS